MSDELMSQIRDEIKEHLHKNKFTDLNGVEYPLTEFTNVISISVDMKNNFFNVLVSMKDAGEVVLKCNGDGASQLTSLASILEFGPISVAPSALILMLENEYSFGQIMGAGSLMKEINDQMAGVEDDFKEPQDVPSNLN